MNLPTPPAEQYRDIVIAGAGPVGAACAIALALRLDPGQRVCLIDGKPGPKTVDPRMIAISAGSKILLDRLGAWDARQATPIEEIHVSERGAFGRTLLSAADYDLAALGYVVKYSALNEMLLHRVAALGIELQQDRIETLTSDAAESVSQLASGRVIRSAYVIHAEGAGAHGIGARRVHDYGQHALTAFVTASHGQSYRAFERFTPDGPIALLPTTLDGQAGYALVWCAKPEQTARRMLLDEASLRVELEAMFGRRVGSFLSIVGQASFPLGLSVSETAESARELRIGNASQTLHPVAGQGFNLGLRDALTLSECIAVDFSDAQRLRQRLHAERRTDQTVTVGMTDFLPRAFGVRSQALAHVRGATLALLDLLPPLRHPLARQMMNGQR